MKQLLITCAAAISVIIVIALFVWLRTSNKNNATAISAITTSTSPTTTTAINNSSSLPTLAPTSTNSSTWGEYVVNQPNALILVDSEGRRTGKDPITGTLYHEIPNTSYKEETVNPGHPNGELFVSNLPNGQYTLNVLGGGTGSYALDIVNGYGQQEFQGNIQKGSIIAYVQDYNQANIPSSTFSFSDTVFSTASSTSPSQHIPLWSEYHVSLPDALILVDSQGRRTGQDPIAGTFYDEIPGTSYAEIGPGSGNGAGELFTSDLPSGQYTLYVLGGKTGSYWLDASHSGQQDQTFQGTIQAGSMVAYVQNYDAVQLASSTFAFERTVSSTASITSAPPHNLPPSPVP